MLKGNQKVLDKNKSGDLDREDFELLRAGKKGKKKKKRKDEQFIDRVINILVEMRVDEISPDLATAAALEARRRGKHPQARRLMMKADKRGVAQTPKAPVKK